MYYILIIDIVLAFLMIHYYQRMTGYGEQIEFTQENLVLSRELMDENQVPYISKEPGGYLDTSYMGKNVVIESPSFVVDRGMYTVTVDYVVSNGNVYSWAGVKSGGEWNSLFSSEIPLNKENNRKAYTIYSNKEGQEITIKNRLSSEALEGEYLLVEGISIAPASPNKAACIVLTVLFILGIDILYITAPVWRKKIPDKILFGMLLLLFLSCYPLFTDALVNGHDLEFHLMRIEGIKEGLAGGQFPVKIQPNWCNGSGYAVGTMYGDTLLYVPALLRMIGVPLQTTYKCYVVLVNFLTIVISYFSFTGIAKDEKIGFVCSTLYTLAVYRLADIYTRAAVGEYTAMIFYPLVLYGLYLAYREKSERAIPALAISFSGVIQSHILSCEMTVFFTLLVCVILWKETFTKKIFSILFKAGLWFVGINLWFLIPFLDFFLNLPLQVKYTVGNDYWIQQKGVTLTKLFSLKGTAFSGITGGSTLNVPATVGISFALILVLFFLNRMQTRKGDREGILCLALAAFSLFLSTAYFPYNWFAQNIRGMKNIIGSLQFPWRFLAISVLLLSLLACIVLRKIGDKELRNILYLICFVTAVQGWYFGEEVLETQESRQIYDGASLDSIGVASKKEYLLEGTELSEFLTEPLGSDGVVVRSYERTSGKMSVEIENVVTDGYVELPFVYYKGYKAVDADGKRYQISSGKNNQVRVEMPVGSTLLSVRFVEPLIWRLGEIFSIFILEIGCTFIWNRSVFNWSSFRQLLDS